MSLLNITFTDPAQNAHTKCTHKTHTQNADIKRTHKTHTHKMHTYQQILCHHFMGYSFQLAARFLLYAPPHLKIAHTMAFVTLNV